MPTLVKVYVKIITQKKATRRILLCLPISLIIALILETKGPTSLGCIFALSLRSAPAKYLFTYEI